MNKQVIAAFDFDGTLTRGSHSRLLFLRHLVGLPNLIKKSTALFILKQINRFWSLKAYDIQNLDRLLLTGFDKQILEQYAKEFVESVLNKIVRQEAIERLQFHQQQNHNCLLISGAWDIYLKLWAKQYNFDRVICTELDFDSITNKSTGLMQHPYCVGDEKLYRFKKIYQNREQYILYAYGDSIHDLPLLDYSDYAFYRKFE